MTDPAVTDRIISQGRALVRAIEALGTIERLDAESDALVYELYGLTEEEITVVEGRSREQGIGRGSKSTEEVRIEVTRACPPSRQDESFCGRGRICQTQR